MKKLISYFTILLSIFILGNVKNVLATEIVSDDIPNSTYIIGKCMFTREVSSSYNGSLSTDVIMLAAKTIDSNKLEDMIIYYKNARGVWVNALTNQKVNIGEKINVEYKNNEIYLMTPTLSNPSGIDTETLKAQLTIGYEGVYAVAEEANRIAGYELYEKVGSEFKLIGTAEELSSIEVTIEPGEKRIFIARVYALNTKNEKVYSAYSNEVVITNYVSTPTLINSSLTACGTSDCEFVPELKDGKYRYDLSIKDQNESFTGYEIYEKNGETYTKVGEGKVHNPEVVMVTVEPGEKRIFVARVYAEKTNGEKVYSEYSNEVIIDHSTYETPTLSNPSGIDAETLKAQLTIGYEGAYAISKKEKAITGYELYEKVGSEFKLIGTTEGLSSIEVTVEPGEKRIFLARVYAEKANGEKVYSEYSNELILEKNVETPTLVNTTLTACGTSPECEPFVPEFNDGKYYYDLSIKDQNESFTGYEIYEKNGETYTKVGEGKVHNPEVVMVTVEPGEKRIFVARVYAEKANGEKVYSEYSNELILEKE